MQTQSSTETQPVSSLSHQIDEEHVKRFFLPPKSDEPGLAVTLILNRGLKMPLSTSSCISGFNYPAEIHRNGILQEHWQRFTQPICSEAKLLSNQCTTMIGHDSDTLAMGGVIVGVFGAVPAFFVPRTARLKQQQRNLLAGLADSLGETLARHLSHWNNSFFRPRGIVIRLDLLGGNWDYLDGTRYAMRSVSFTDKGIPEEATQIAARVVIIPLKI